MLKQFKLLSKMSMRDASLRNLHKGEIATIHRDIERWIAEAKTVSKNSIGNWDSGYDADGAEHDAQERWALDRLCSGLLGKGGLVSFSKKCVFREVR
jgi:ribosomal biogenesis protein LAS1